jgi:hypothetical protein
MPIVLPRVAALGVVRGRSGARATMAAGKAFGAGGNAQKPAVGPRGKPASRVPSRDPEVTASLLILGVR